MTDYLESAKNALAVAILDDDAATLAEAQVFAIISIAESLANSSQDAKATAWAKAWAKGYEAGSKRTDGTGPMTDTYADGFLDGWQTAAETLRTRFHLTARKPAADPRIDAERLGDRIEHSDLPEGKPWLVGPQEPLRLPTFVPRVWAEVDSHPEAYTPGSIRLTPTDLDALADCDSCTVHLLVGGACLHCGWAAL